MTQIAQIKKIAKDVPSTLFGIKKSYSVFSVFSVLSVVKSVEFERYHKL